MNVRGSATGTGYGSAAVDFNSSTLNLNCAVSPITAVLSSTPDSTGYVLVDNNINVTVTAGQTKTGSINVCKGGVSTSPIGPFQNCFTATYQAEASAGSLTDLSPDNFVATGGVPPMDISANFVPGPIQVKIDLQDEGGYLAGSTLYLNTNCTQGGVTGPALVSGNPISKTAPTPDQLSQDFSFNPIVGQQIGFEYDLTEAQSSGSLIINNGTIPQVADSPIDPATFQTVLAAQTSFATASCLIHTGELLPNGQPACKLFTLECKTGTGANATGAQCPISSMPNEIFRDTFNGTSFSLPDIATPSGPTFHEGIGFLMASEGWTGGPCTFDPTSGLQNLPCPQNLLSSFTGPTAQTADTALAVHPRANALVGGRAQAQTTTTSSSGQYTSVARTTHPNSAFLSIVQVPEDLTTITVAGQRPGGWINHSTASVTLSSQPPNLSGTTLPGAASFIASPIQSITYGISPTANVPLPGQPIPGDTVLLNPIACPATSANANSPASVFTPDSLTLSSLADGYYQLHYYAQDCAGTEELKFTQDGNGVWSTSFYTFPINVDTVAPAVASGPVLSPAQPVSGTYTVGQTVTASFSCTDSLSGITQCGSYTYAPGATNSTGTLTSSVDTSTPGTKTFTVQVTDAAGNQSSASVQYSVVPVPANPVQITLGTNPITYPQGTTLVINITPSSSNAVRKAQVQSAAQTHVPTGTVKVFDGAKLLQTLRLQGNGAAYSYIQNLIAGPHALTVAYSGDAYNPPATSAPVTLTVLPAPVTLSLSCWNATAPYGSNYFCGAYTSSQAGPPKGVIAYQYDSASPVTVPLTSGVALFQLHKPPAGAHTVTVTYAAQTNYAAAGPQSSNFTITAAPVNVQLTPSSWYLTGGTLGLTAFIKSSSAGAPSSIGSVAFYDGKTLLGTLPVSGNGTACLTIAASALSKGSHNFTATYSGGPNYGNGSGSATVTVAGK